MNGSRRVRATPVLPRAGPSCLLKGHLGTKSNAFCTDSSSLRLSTLHMIKNHMAVHYNKILSAKAVVDCSVPLSMSASIKYADQQRREKLKKELAQCERQLKLTKTTVQSNSKHNSKSLCNSLQKLAEEPSREDGMLLEEVNEYASLTRSPVTFSERLQLSAPPLNPVLTDGTERNFGSPVCSVGHKVSVPRKTCSAALAGGPPRSTFPNASRLQPGLSKAPSGDLLDKHSKLFSNRHLPFTPRTLKTEAKSFLSQYRYYTPAKRKKGCTHQGIEVETQTDLSSFNSDFETVKNKDFIDSEVNIKQASNSTAYGSEENVSPLPLGGSSSPGCRSDGSPRPCPRPRAICQCSMQHPSSRQIYSDEEELLYLSFIEDVTDEILNLGLFSNRSLEQLFERHVRQNKHHLEEEKMRYLLHILKVNLGCTSKENSLKLDDMDMLNLPNFEKAVNSEQNLEDASIQQERQEYRKALDMLLSSPKDENELLSNEFFLPIYKVKASEGVIIQQVNEETKPRPWDEKNPNISDSLIDPETSVTVIEGDSDTEKAETSNELGGFSTALSRSVRLCSVKGDNDHDLEEPTLKVMEMNIEDSPLDV